MPPKGKKNVKNKSKSSDPQPDRLVDLILPAVDSRSPQVSHQHDQYHENLKPICTGEKVNLASNDFMGERISTKVFEHLTTYEIRDLKTVFDAFANKRGTISVRNIKKAFHVLGFKMTKDQVAAMVADMDFDQLGTINFNEFLQYIIDKQGTARDVHDEIMQGFRMFDYENTGHITLANLKRACMDAGVRFTDAELRGMIDEADCNGDNMVDLEEFTTIMLKTNLF